VCGQIVSWGGVVEEPRLVGDEDYCSDKKKRVVLENKGEPENLPTTAELDRPTQRTEGEAPSRSTTSCFLLAKSCSNLNFRSSTLVDGFLNRIDGNHQQIKSQNMRKCSGSKWSRH
jgi:hypothetical protein